MKTLVFFMSIMLSFFLVQAQTEPVGNTPNEPPIGDTQPAIHDVAIYDKVTSKAEFDNSFNVYKFISEKIRYPETAIEAGAEGKALVCFVVEKDGSITGVQIERSTNNRDLDREAIRVVKSLPKMIPAKVGDKPVRSKYRLPIQFKLVD